MTIATISFNAAFRGMVCQQPPYTGPCKASFRRFYYNVAQGVCQPFLYGGCQSNGNNFETIEQCKQACGGKQDFPIRPRPYGQPRIQA
ncbi:hypothetical protein HPB48_027041 [Haemaphysalis longicornis]|uniref:BPTI/Kunitz inhibitor domain-containing protein n=1 Tax=Haemaphysalis longicornis TaxID=44386 RepID=A0A9J6HDU0_HAELO|nr:hypothetical protein HPB48_027041 [Haemaphysalis longicornis]